MWFSRKQEERVQPHGKIEVFSRHCFFSSISKHKKRFEGFSREKCYANLIETIDLEKVNLRFILDVAKGSDHFLKGRENVVEIREGTEAGAFLKLLEHVESLDFHPETVLYFVEDDYLHRKGWVDVLLEGMMLADYATLYDHKDKYFFPMYNGLKSKVFHTASCHWRTVPSTTQTFAVRWKTLKKDMEIHRNYSLGREISQDHQKFLKLGKRGAILVSSIPGYSTHAEPEFASPCTDWENMLQQELLCKPSPSN